MKYLIQIILSLAVFYSFGQQKPFINSLDKTSAVPGETLIISGSGFNPGNMQVSLGAGIANITNTTASSIEVTVPLTATYGPVTALDLATGQSGVSSQQFFPKYYGQSFEPTSVGSQVNFATNQQYVYDLCACDLDNDGLNDVAVANNKNISGVSISIFKNTSSISTPSFTRINIPNDYETASVVCGDFNADGMKDLVFGTNEGTNLYHLFIYENTSTSGAISFKAPLKIQLPKKDDGKNRAPRNIKIEDINGDGKKDLVVGISNENTIYVYPNTSTVGGNTTFGSPVVVEVTGVQTTSLIETSDINGDGIADLVVSEFPAQGVIAILKNESTIGSISFNQTQTIENSLERYRIILADLDGDNSPEIVCTSKSNGIRQVEIYKNNSTLNNINFDSSPTILPNITGAWGVKAGDIDGDGKVDLSIASIDNFIYVLENKSSVGSISFDNKSISTTNNNRNIAVFDVNGDARPDFVTANKSEQSTFGNISVFLNQNCLAPTISPADLTFCTGNPFTISTIPSFGTTYNWSVTSGDATLGSNGASSTTVTVNTGVSATIKVAITSTLGGCVDETSQTFNLTGGTPPAAPTITNDKSGIICSGETFTLSGPTGMDTYLWTLPDGSDLSQTTNTLEVTNITAKNAGEYSLRTQQTGSCYSETGSITVSISEPPSISIHNQESDIFCETSSATLEVPQYTGFSYQWKKDGTNISGETSTVLTASESGDYSVTITSDATSCPNQSDAYTLRAVSLPTSSFNAIDEVCINIDTVFTATSTTTESDLTLIYNWDFGDGTTATTNQVTHAFNSAQTFNVKLSTQYAEVANCPSSVSKNVVVSAIPNISISTPDGTEKCPADSLRLELPQDLLNYNWSTGSNSYFTYAKTVGTQETATVNVTATTSVQCPIEANITISNFNNSRIGLTSTDATITNDTIVLESGISTVLLQATNGNGTDYAWTPESILDNSSTENVKAFPNDKFTTITVTGPDAVNGCMTSASLVVETPGVIPRKTFSPNGDGLGYDCWEILNTENLNGCKVYIFDERGSSVYSGTSPFTDNCVWNGYVNGGSAQAPEGIYYFVMKCNNSIYNTSGYIILAR